MADWTTCRVVRDRDGDLWFRGCDSDDLWTANTNYPDVCPASIRTTTRPDQQRLRTARKDLA